MTIADLDRALERGDAAVYGPARIGTGVPRPQRRPAATGLDPRIAWALLAVYVVLAAGIAAGVVHAGISSMLIATSTIAIVVGIRVNRPQLSWPFWGFVTSGVFWAIAGAARAATGSTGDLTAGRSLWPDVFAVPGYVAYGLGLIAMVRARDGRDRGALIDAVVVSIGGFLLSWQFLISHTLASETVSPVARGSIILYPVLDCAFVALACRLAFTSSRRLPVHGLILLGMCGMLVGDVSYVFDEMDLWALGPRRDLGYVLAAAAMGAAGLHPSVRMLHLRGTARRKALPTGRAILLALSMLLPAGLFIFGLDDRSVRALPFQVGVVALAVVATCRLLDSVRHQNEATDALAWQADHDSLTGLPNRHAITTCIDERVRDRPGHQVIAYFDLDHFKNINDALGHLFGDRLLVAVADRLRTQLPECVVLGRIGGDEFVAICDIDDVCPATLAAHIRAALGRPVMVSDLEVSTTASIGITVTQGERDADAILRDADTAMYRAKSSGRNTHAEFTDDMRIDAERRIRTERALRDALERGGELRAWFQPLHDLGSNEIIGFEALARWITPTGMVPPNEFIDVAEDTGLITQVGAVILDQACAAIAHARTSTGRDLFVSVNVSTLQLVDDGIIRVVADALERHDLPGEALCLEITESIMVNDQNVERLGALRQLGVALAVDDFGTGYSSLSYLHRMPISKVKIDKSFVDDIATGDPSIMVAILSMAHSLRLTCIAEGIETGEQADRMQALGCDSGQGYYWSKPVPIAELDALIELAIVAA